MILYTLAPLSQQLFPFETTTDDELPTVCCSLTNGYLQGTMTPYGMRVTRMESTNPADYLKCENDIGFLRTDIHSSKA